MTQVIIDLEEGQILR